MTCAFSCTQMILRFTSVSSLLTGAVHKVEHCLAEIRDWMERNYLKMNDDKTVVSGRHPTSSFQPWNHSHQAGRVRRYSFTQCQKHRRGVRQRDVDEAASDPCLSSSLYWHLHTISTIRSSITQDAAVKLVLALVVSRLDFANALYYTGAAGLSHLPAAESAECCCEDGLSRRTA